jgi:hypothetical protein
MEGFDRVLDSVEWEKLPDQSQPGSLPVATHRGILRIVGLELEVFQLDNGQRVFSVESLNEAFGDLFGARGGI